MSVIIRVFSFGPLSTNAILLGCGVAKRSAIIDPGVGSTDVLLKALQKEELVLDKILLTHSHWDHIAGVRDLQLVTGAPVYIHPLDLGNLERPGSDRIPLFVPVQGAHTDHLLQDGQWLEVGSLKIQVIHTPGHSPGGVCFYLPEQHVLFSGDTVFRGTMGSLELPTSSSTEMWPSLKKLASLPPETRVIPGHGQETTIGREAWLSRAKDLFME